MFCPSCRKAYGPGIVACPDCREVLVEERPEEPRPEWVDYVVVLESSDATLIAVAMSMLEAAGIRCRVRNQAVQDLIGIGRIASGFNVLTGAPKLEVQKEREEEARALLLAAQEPDDLDETGPDDD